MSNSKMTVAEAGRRGIQASIRKYGAEGHARRCRMAVAARTFYARNPKNGRKLWSQMSQKQKEDWCEEHVKSG
jgi:hypothetical protein